MIELLVVIAIIAILASLLLPVMARGKSAALATECRNNLRTLALAMRMSLDESDRYPTALGVMVVGANASYGILTMTDWKETLLPFVGLTGNGSIDSYANMRLLRCPQMLRNSDGALGNCQYALNASGTAPFQSPLNLGLGGFFEGQLRPTLEASVLAPADMIAIGDVAPGRTTTLPPDFPIRKGFAGSSYFDVCSTNSTLWPGRAHNAQANMLFCDGHVESARQTNWLSTNNAARARWNNDHHPHPETWARR